MRGDVFAIAILALYALVGVLGFYSGRQNERRTYEPHQHAISAADAAQERCVGREPRALAECVIEEIAAAEETSRDEQDLQAQQQMALWALLMFIASGATLGATIWALVYVKQTLDETKRMAVDTGRMAKEARNATSAARDAVTETQRIGEAQVRCYLSGVSAQIGFTYDQTLVANCTIRNSGQSPAKDVRAKGTFTFINPTLEPAQTYWTFAEVPAGIAINEMDLPAGGEDTVSFHLRADLTSIDFGGISVEQRGIALLEIAIFATDVFGVSVEASDKFVCHPSGALQMNKWVDLKREARVIVG